MTKRLLSLLVLFLTLNQNAKPDSHLLFNGKDFTGWEVVMSEDSVPVEQLVTIDDEVLTLHGNQNPKGIFRTKAAYSNYELVFQWRWPNKPGNSGLMLHCDPAVTTAAWPKCLEVQLMYGKAGQFRKNGETIEVEPERTTSKPFLERLILDAEKPAGEWNTLRVIASERTMEVYINDQLVNKGTNASASSGFIALQLELADIQFRAIKLKYLQKQ